MLEYSDVTEKFIDLGNVFKKLKHGTITTGCGNMH